MLRTPFDPCEQAPARIDDPGPRVHLRAHDHAFHAQQRLFRHLVRRRQPQPCGDVAEIARQVALVPDGLLPVAGIDVVRELPPGIDKVEIFSTGLHAKAPQPGIACDFVRHLVAAEAVPVMRRTGLDPLTGSA